MAIHNEISVFIVDKIKVYAKTSTIKIVYLTMVTGLIAIASTKLGSKRQLVIALGFPEKQANQRV